MSEFLSTMITAVITGLFATLGVWITENKRSALMTAKLDKKISLIEAKMGENNAIQNEKIENLTKEVRAHNSFASKIPVMENEQENLKRRISDLERAVERMEHK